MIIGREVLNEVPDMIIVITCPAWWPRNEFFSVVNELLKNGKRNIAIAHEKKIGLFVLTCY